MLDKLYETVQAILNKTQLGGIKPMHFNLFAYTALFKLFGRLLLDLKTNVRKQNWHLDGKDFANLAEHTRQLLEHYSEIKDINSLTSGDDFSHYVLPEDVEFIEDVFAENIRVAKISYGDLKKLQRNIYAKPSDCTPKGARVGNAIKVSPSTIGEIELHYLRKPKTPNWTFQDVGGKPMFDPTANDFEDLDLPNSMFDEMVSLVVEIASIHLRDFEVVKAENVEQSQDVQAESKQ